MVKTRSSDKNEGKDSEKSSDSRKRTACDVMLYYPNLVGYFRLVCTFLSIYYAKINPTWTIILYLSSFGGDVIDGYVARMFNQCSKFGGVLDMVTDRISTAGFLAILTNLYPTYSYVFIFLMMLDIGSHWFHVVSSDDKHHKSKEALEHRNALLQWYYSIYVLFGYCCVGAEMFYVLLYAYSFFPSPLLFNLCFYGCLPACVLKNIINVVQWWDAMYIISLRDADDANSKRDH